MNTAGRNPWAVLGLTENASMADVKRAYRALVKRTHPDLGGDPQRFIAVKAAFDAICASAAPEPAVCTRRSTPYDRWMSPAQTGRTWFEETPDPRRRPTQASARAVRFEDLLASEMARTSAAA